jgi:hypothetical protein
MLGGLLASTPIADRTLVDKRKWARVALEFAQALLVESAAFERAVTHDPLATDLNVDYY